MDLLASRFIARGDPHDADVVFPLPEPWWSRPYEYAWAAGFARSTDVVLDVACGVCHPFKFRLAELAAETHACDADPRVTSPEAILADIAECAGAEAAASFDRARLTQVRLQACDMTRMPYADGSFDRVFCVSVLEHLTPPDQLRALIELARVLADDGLIVLTVDHPTVDLDRLRRDLDVVGLRFAGDVDFTIPPDAISSSYWGPELRCVRLALTRDPSFGG
jgi:SAM-dependent methyltransferase